MKRINILEHIYTCHADAYDRLKQYLTEINNKFKSESEIIRDIELSIVEQLDLVLDERTSRTVTLIDVDFLIQKLGEIEMFDDLTIDNDYVVTRQHLYRDYENRIIGGVCAGIAAYFNISPWLVRFIFIICMFTPIPIVIPYLLMWYFLPPAITKSEQLNMRGIPVNISSIVNSSSYTRKKVINIAKLVVLTAGVIVLIIVSISIAVLIF